MLALSSCSILDSILRKTLWVVAACADRPGFLVWTQLVPNSQLQLGASDCAPQLAFAAHFLGHLLGSAAHSSPPSVHKRDAQHKFLHHKGAHTDNHYKCRHKKVLVPLQQKYFRIEFQNNFGLVFLHQHCRIEFPKRFAKVDPVIW